MATGRFRTILQVSRRQKRVHVHLDSSGVRSLSHDEILMILRGADAMIAAGGRTQLAKVLKGSRDKAVIERGLEQVPAYGFYRELTLDEIIKRVDWMIEHDYLDITYSGRLPVLIFTERGWAIECEMRARELLHGFDLRLGQGPPFDLSDLKDRNRGMIMLLLDKVESSGRADFIPLLEAWGRIDYAKVRARIQGVIRALRTPDTNRAIRDI
jgi:hypothetical protein